VRRRRDVRWALVACATLVAAGCSLARRTPEPRYYTLAVPGAPVAHLPAPVRVGVFTRDQPYATARLAYRTSPYRLNYYTYHRWAADPALVVAAAVRDYLERAGGADGAPPFVIEGHLRRLEEVDAAGSRQGALTLDVRVMRDGQVVLERSYTETEPADAETTEAVAAALSRALGRVLDRVAGELAGGVEAEAQPGQAPSVRVRTRRCYLRRVLTTSPVTLQPA
jgi:ABC-type uncharacterized transport system auxiliary subunit